MVAAAANTPAYTAAKTYTKERTRTLIADALAAATAPLDATGEAMLGPPLAGGRIIDRASAGPDTMRTLWFDELNLDPRTRVASRVGADAIRSVQEDLMQAAWEQVGDVLDAARVRYLLSYAALTCECAKAYLESGCAGMNHGRARVEWPK